MSSLNDVKILLDQINKSHEWNLMWRSKAEDEVEILMSGMCQGPPFWSVYSGTIQDVLDNLGRILEELGLISNAMVYIQDQDTGDEHG